MNEIGFGCAIFAIAGIAFLIWWSRNPIVFTTAKGTFPELTGRQLRHRTEGAVTIELVLSGNTEGYAITQLTMTRELAQRLDLSPPVGFVAEPLPLERRERSDPETVKFVEDWNAQNVQWTGNHAMQPAVPFRLEIPATQPEAAAGQLSIQYQRRGRLGGVLTSMNVRLNEPLEENEGSG